MLIIAQGEEINSYPELADQMFRLRARAFSDRRGWRVKVEEGRERDYFDDLGPLYFCLTENDHLLASLRLLPSTGPHMLSDVFPEVMGDTGIVRHPLIWESSRFCVDTEAARTFSADGINVVTRSILTGLFVTAREVGLVNIISVYDVFVERILRRAGCAFDRLGPVVSYDDLNTVGGLFEVSDTVIHQLKSVGSHCAARSLAS
ncbi:MAG: acyl-homoserine-lactone synthase [Hydrogenophilales bacterium CG17_big_fil_post_rev_8_21_14_2_50_63_12]|nr:acyl-homoserine-lactone synthase [Rhodobacterales bacterium]PIV89036.1 MAG: acyl-homoserine-lactone synthase [Hydrogenophilales bacterium CG17_big_fil_post_rev_8_21_14_2_50_63_12]